MEQAEESATAGLEGRRGKAPKEGETAGPDVVNGGIKFITGRARTTRRLPSASTR